MSVPLKEAIQHYGQSRAAKGGLSASTLLQELSFATLLDVLPDTDSPAIYSVDRTRKTW